MEASRGLAKRRRLRLILYAVVLAPVLWLLFVRSGTLAASGGAASLARRGTAPALPIPHKKTAACRVSSFLESEQLRRCSDPYAHPFSGCLTDSYEAGMFKRLLAGKKASNLRCGFLDAPSRQWLDSLHVRFASCSRVVFTVSFSYGELPSTEGVAAEQPGVCFVAFVDAAAVQQLQGAAGFDGSRYGRWELVEVEHTMFSDGMARSAHMIKILAPRLFSAASAALYIDTKVGSADCGAPVAHLLRSSPGVRSAKLAGVARCGCAMLMRQHATFSSVIPGPCPSPAGSAMLPAVWRALLRACSGTSRPIAKLPSARSSRWRCRPTRWRSSALWSAASSPCCWA